MIQEAAKCIASDNLELACVRLQTEAVRRAFKKIDEALEGEYRKRCQCRKDGHRFTNPMVQQIQADLPEPLRQHAGGCTAQKRIPLSRHEERLAVSKRVLVTTAEARTKTLAAKSVSETKVPTTRSTKSEWR